MVICVVRRVVSFLSRLEHENKFNAQLESQLIRIIFCCLEANEPNKINLSINDINFPHRRKPLKNSLGSLACSHSDYYRLHRTRLARLSVATER